MTDDNLVYTFTTCVREDGKGHALVIYIQKTGNSVFKATWNSPRNNSHTVTSSKDAAVDLAVAGLSASYPDHAEAISKGALEALRRTEQPAGMKADGGKLRWWLLPLKTLAPILRVLEFGASKYSPGNWMYVENGRERYFEALMRHLAAWQDGEASDPETGESHLAHAGCCILFLIGLEMGMGKTRQ